MPKEIPVLHHHRFNIGQEFFGLSVDDVPEIKKRIAIKVTRLSKLRTITGEVVYPGLQTKKGREAYNIRY